MHEGLEHLSEQRRGDLERVLHLVFAEFEKALASATQPWKKAGRILKVILYGSYLSAPTSSEPNESKAIDLLIVVNDQRLTEFADIWSPVEDRLLREWKIATTLHSNVNLLVYSLVEVNRQLRCGAQFFSDIISKGVALYNDEASNFDSPIHLPPAQAKAVAQAHFDFWYPLSINARRLASRSLELGEWRDAAFLLHQAVERAYHCALLVLTLYSPKTHRIELLRANSERVAPVLARAWSGEDASRQFARLRQAYNSARYDRGYRLKPSDLRWIEERVRLLQELVRIEKAIQDLPDPVRHAFIALRLEGLEYEDIAERMGLTLSQVEARIREALDLIVQALRDSERAASEIETLH